MTKEYVVKDLDDDQERAVLVLENESEIHGSIIETANAFYESKSSLSKVMSSCYLHNPSKASRAGEVDYFGLEKLDQISFYMLDRVLKETYPNLFKRILQAIVCNDPIASRVFKEKPLVSKGLIGKRVIYDNDDHCCFKGNSRQGWEGTIVSVTPNSFCVKWDRKSDNTHYVAEALRNEVKNWPDRRSERSYIKIIDFSKSRDEPEEVIDSNCAPYGASELTTDELFEHIASWSDYNKKLTKTEKESTMSKEMKLSIVVYLDGIAVEDITDAQLISYVAELEQEIASLKKIEVTSKRIDEKITKMKAKIMTLVGILDSRCEDEESVEITVTTK